MTLAIRRSLEVCTLVALLACAVPCAAADDPKPADVRSPQNAPVVPPPSGAGGSLVGNALGAALGLINVQYEKPLRNGGASILVQGALLMPYLIDDLDWAFGGGGGVRKYLGSGALKGGFVQGVGLVTLASGSGTSGSALQANGIAGYKWISGGRFTTEVQGGLAVASGTVGRHDFSGMTPVVGVYLGYSW